MRATRLLAAFLGLIGPTGLVAQAPEPPCPATAPALPPELAGWATKAAITAAAQARDGAKSVLAPGQAATIALLPTPQVRYPAQPAKAGDGASHGGLVSFAVATPGTYRVALGAGAWIAVAQRGSLLASVGHGHGPACSGVRKMVDFALRPGRYVLEIAASAQPSLDVMIARLP